MATCIYKERSSSGISSVRNCDIDIFYTFLELNAVARVPLGSALSGLVTSLSDEILRTLTVVNGRVLHGLYQFNYSGSVGFFLARRSLSKRISFSGSMMSLIVSGGFTSWMLSDLLGCCSSVVLIDERTSESCRVHHLPCKPCDGSDSGIHSIGGGEIDVTYN